MRGGRARLAWTTNFDPLIADGCAKVYGGTGQLTTVAIETGGIGRHVVDEGRWPVEVKLHGDFRSRRLKNTGDELREHDAKLRALLIDCCSRWGMIVAGYSGRDDSIMDTLEAVLERGTPFPSGFFWLHRGEEPPLPRVQRLLAAAGRKDVDGGLVQIENFDETLRDLVRLTADLDTTTLDELAFERRIWSPAPRPTGNRGFPVVRINALELIETPTVCRRVACGIGGVAEGRSAIEVADLPVLATRSRAGVLAFGADADVRAVLSTYGIESFDLHPIEVRRLRYESQERGLLREALTRALTRQHGMIADRRRSSDLLLVMQTPTRVLSHDPAAFRDAQLKVCRLEDRIRRLLGASQHPEGAHDAAFDADAGQTRPDFDHLIQALLDPKFDMVAVDLGESGPKVLFAGNLDRVTASDAQHEQNARPTNRSPTTPNG